MVSVVEAVCPLDTFTSESGGVMELICFEAV
jgi:hypothetical protein